MPRLHERVGCLVDVLDRDTGQRKYGSTLMTFQSHITRLNTCDLAAYRPLLVDGRRIGHLPLPVISALSNIKGIQPDGGGGLVLLPSSVSQRSEVVELIVDRLIETGWSVGRRREYCAAVGNWGEDPLFRVDRGSLVPLGLRAFGIHVNGFVRRSDGLHMWIGRRALDMSIAPGKLDHMIAGGQPFGLTLAANLRKEAEEEAGLATSITDLAQPAGVVTYTMGTPRGVRVDTLFVFDLEMPDGLVPVNRDGEVAAFELWPVMTVRETVADSEDFKFNVNLVLIDFMIRHGIIGPEEPSYVELVTGLRGTLPPL